jgi:Arc/MetJ-type ribon-helix-helix transcriptional regulator
MTDYATLKLPASLVERLQRAVDSSAGAFANVEDYAAFVLGETLKEVDTTGSLSAQDKKLIEERLKKLGYA